MLTCTYEDSIMKATKHCWKEGKREKESGNRMEG
jgi:hypothetical protein